MLKNKKGKIINITSKVAHTEISKQITLPQKQELSDLQKLSN